MPPELLNYTGKTKTMNLTLTRLKTNAPKNPQRNQKYLKKKKGEN